MREYRWKRLIYAAASWAGLLIAAFFLVLGAWLFVTLVILVAGK